eukprot:CAMPEP_0204359902 /NCGR_PEP_ID=MMETSP0469-20131031/37622_1 /ASSEMBLY_ACC=CAM_ASM_000384 /TAXON_ID=2969 /ORGANISM="Oxyrrhis marina" /LENGTH=87 /DNA_ID=CAMNT_0051348019 /DNA_START=126 /DNA_END=386 /DNA_ORIENTATION=+
MSPPSAADTMVCTRVVDRGCQGGIDALQKRDPSGERNPKQQGMPTLQKNTSPPGGQPSNYHPLCKRPPMRRWPTAQNLAETHKRRLN